MLTGQLSNGLVEVTGPGGTEILGYAYTVPEGRGQLQRWLLFRDPVNQFELRAPPVEMARWSLEEWQSHVASMWRPGSFYVWAQTDIYEYDRIYLERRWDQIPLTLPPPTYPTQGSSFQLDPTGYHVINVNQWSTNLWGIAYTVQGLCDATATGKAWNAEYWLLPSGFEPAGGTNRTSISVGTLPADSLERFVMQANTLWAPGAVFAITGCKSHFGQVAPAEP